MWATKARQLYYPNPFPNHFYSGSTKEEEFIGLRENYYAWEWGDALFVVLDPYWYTITKPGKSNDNWNWTLGYDQYSWFKQTLEESNATFKFVFCHQLVGGKDTEGRGGSEYANYYEMGGLNEDNSWGFNEKRSVWGKPIHQLMVDYHVNIFFHGHDHFFAKQNVDGVIYQLVPQPSHPNYKKTGQAEPYGYVNGVILSNSGHLRVTVEETDVTVDYIRAYLPENETDGRKNGEIGYSYTINATDSVETSLKNSNVQPSLFELDQNFPNPFNSGTDITFTLQQKGNVSLKINNILGQQFNLLDEIYLQAGEHRIHWQANHMASGIYYYTLTAGSQKMSKKMILLQ